jgi:hypothetical protein
MDNIGTIYNVKIPSLNDDANIQEALKIYHYGTLSTIDDVTDLDNAVNPGVAVYLRQIQNDVSSRVSLAPITEGGDLFVGIGSEQVEVLSVPESVKTSGLEHVLTYDPTQSNAKHLIWATSSKEEERIAHIMGVF